MIVGRNSFFLRHKSGCTSSDESLEHTCYDGDVTDVFIVKFSIKIKGNQHV